MKKSNKINKNKKLLKRQIDSGFGDPEDESEQTHTLTNIHESKGIPSDILDKIHSSKNLHTDLENNSVLSDEPEYTILDEFTKRNKQFILVVLGLPCTNKSEIAKELVVDLGLPLVNINDYLIEGKYIDKEVDGVKFKLYEHPDNYNWKKLNSDVNKLKRRGVIIYGNYLDINAINWKPDVTYFISMGFNICKKKLVENKMLPYEENDPKIQIYFNKIFNPIYDEIKTKFKINKFFNLKEDSTFDSVYNDLFQGLIGMINSKLKK